ncbi:Uma2 family endonuclease [Actinoplanes sp. NEAU-A12]|uniref:Uma2 family endonuclease n=1 Tax=Actinoplanes sandaracinus TaxID=3045177 RepID=A0ABT6WQN8_9ACTN|nr:Uma2 family endonuclease [Actinoplanes sandaracinus]MDI6102052.1 Uma2 family endonuclease [Actinoplanes sandaracinus]
MLSQGSPVRWTAPEGRWTQPDLHLFPQDGHRYEILDGSLHVTPPADARHDSLVESIVATLRSAAPPGWWVCARLGIAMESSNLVPDVTVLRPHSSGAIWVDPADVALVVEIEAAETRRYDRLLKPAVYAAAGIPAYWRVEAGPVLRSFTLDGVAYRPAGDVEPDEQAKLDHPYPIRVNTALWR